MTGYRTALRDTQLVFDIYRSNVAGKVVFQVSCEVAGTVLFVNRHTISPLTVHRILEFGKDTTKDLNIKEEYCIVKSDRGNLRFSGRGRSITVVNQHLEVLLNCLRDSKIGSNLE